MVHTGALPAAFEGAIRLAKEHANLYLDISGSFITGVWIRRMVAELGAERVIFSSDQPFIDPATAWVACCTQDYRMMRLPLWWEATSVAY